MIVEKYLIIVIWLCSIPLFLMDKEMLGFRRFVWLLAIVLGLAATLFVQDFQDSQAEFLDKLTMASVCIVIVPHLMELAKKDVTTMLLVLPPFLVVVFLSSTNSVVNNSTEFWRYRSFLHMGLFLPYINHARNMMSPSPAEDEEEKEEKEETTTTEKKITSASPKKAKTNKHKR